jgi:hypothetical protein
MKLLLFIFSLPCFGQVYLTNYMAEAEIGNAVNVDGDCNLKMVGPDVKGKSAYTKKALCESIEGAVCRALPKKGDVGGPYNCNFHNVVSGSVVINATKKSSWDSDELAKDTAATAELNKRKTRKTSMKNLKTKVQDGTWTSAEKDQILKALFMERLRSLQLERGLKD